MSIGIDPDAPGGTGVPAPRALLAVGVGGAMGTLARHAVVRAVPTAAGSIPWSIVLVNVAGSLTLGFVLHLVLARWPTNGFIRPFVAVGFIGGFTTFSTVMVDADLLVRGATAGAAMAYLAVSVLSGLAAAFIGIAVGRRFRPRAAPTC